MFLLGAVFLFLSIGLVMLGGSVYRKIMDSAAESDELRVTFSYVANQLRRADADGGVELGRLGETEALLLNQTFDGIECITYLYYWDGSLREMFVEKGYELGPEAGLPIIEIEGLGFQAGAEGLITVTATLSGGREESMMLAPRTAAAQATAATQATAAAAQATAAAAQATAAGRAAAEGVGP